MPGLHGMTDSQIPARPYEERVTAATAAGDPSRSEFMAGRVVYLPSIDFDGSRPQFDSFFPVDARFWRAPRNAADIAESVRWAARDRMPVEIAGPDYVASNVVEQPEKQRLIVHLVNYRSSKETSSDPIQVTIRLPECKNVKAGVVYSPDSAGPQQLAATGTPRGIVFAVPLKTYSIVAVSW